MKIIAVDFDGVIHKYENGFQNGELYGEPIEKAKQSLEKLVSAGYEIIIFTVRLNSKWEENKDGNTKGQEDISNWLTKNGFFKGQHYHELTGQKPPAVAYIDDKAIRFTDWIDIKNYFV